MGLRKDLATAFKERGIVGLKEAQSEVDPLNAKRAERIVKSLINRKMEDLSGEQREIIKSIKKSGKTNEVTGVTAYIVDYDTLKRCEEAGLSMDDITLALAEGWQKGQSQATFTLRMGDSIAVIGDNSFHVKAARNSFENMVIDSENRMIGKSHGDKGVTISLRWNIHDSHDSACKHASLDMVTDIVNFAEELRLRSGGVLDSKEALDIPLEARKMANERNYYSSHVLYEADALRNSMAPHIQNPETGKMHAITSLSEVLFRVNQTANISNECKEFEIDGEKALGTGFSFMYDVAYKDPNTNEYKFISAGDVILLNQNGEIIPGIRYNEYKTMEDTNKDSAKCAEKILNLAYVRKVENIQDYLREGLESGELFPEEYLVKNLPINCIVVNEPISFISPTGEEVNVPKGGVLVVGGKDDIYYVDKKTFSEKFKPTERDGLTCLENTLSALGSEKTPLEILKIISNIVKEEVFTNNESIDETLNSLTTDARDKSNISSRQENNHEDK